ncbi:MAG: DUF3298 domain-containing protein [Patescibacteria group bacterium]
MNKDTLVGGGVLLLVVVGLVIYAATKPVPAKAPVTETPPFTLPESSFVERTASYDIEAYYASSTPLVGAANEAAVSLMKDFIREYVVEFRNPSEMADTENPFQLKIVYLTASSTRAVAYVYTIYTFTGGAHGNMEFRTFTFDTTSGKLLALADLFTSGSDYLGTLSQLARARLSAVIGEGYDQTSIKDGTEPTGENFQNFFFDNNELVILFPPYQVAAYAAGPQTLRLPLSLLSKVLKSEYR